MSKRVRSWALWVFVCAGAALVALLFIEYAERSDFRKAAEWHKMHGNLALVDGHKLSLPEDWWEKDEPEGEKRIFIKASRSLTKVSSTGIVLDRRGLEESKAGEGQIIKNMESFMENEKKGNHGPISTMIVVRAVSTNIYCTQTLIIEQDVKLRCEVVGAPILLSSVGPPSTEKEVESILSTFE